MRLTDEQVEIVAEGYLKWIMKHPMRTTAASVRVIFEIAEDIIGIDTICGHVDGSPFKYKDEL